LLFLYLVFIFFSLVVFFSCIINFITTIFLSLFLLPSHPPLFLCYNPLFSLPTTLSSHSHPHSVPVFTFPSFPSQPVTTLFPPSYSLNTHWLVYCTTIYNLSPLQSLTSILHYNNRNTHKHTQGPQNPAAPTSLTQPTPFLAHHF
jgi:hypothetical protein